MRQISTISSFVPRRGTPQAVQFAAARELIGKGDNGAPHAQEAVASLLTLLALGVKNIHLGPGLPAGGSPDILNLLVENWGIKPISTPDEDLKALLG